MFRKLREETLEEIAHIIAGSKGSGPKISKRAIVSFFRDNGLSFSKSKSTDPVDYAFENLREFNLKTSGRLVPKSIENLLTAYLHGTRWSGQPDDLVNVKNEINKVIKPEGLKIELNRNIAVLTDISPKYLSVPLFRKIITDIHLVDLLELRWTDGQKCMQAGAHLPAIIMFGSILEGVLLWKARKNKSDAVKAKAAKSKNVDDMTLNELIDIALELRWLPKHRAGYSGALRMSRNIVHPQRQLEEKVTITNDDCEMAIRALQTALKDLL